MDGYYVSQKHPPQPDSQGFNGREVLEDTIGKCHQGIGLEIAVERVRAKDASREGKVQGVYGKCEYNSESWRVGQSSETRVGGNASAMQVSLRC